MAFDREKELNALERLGKTLSGLNQAVQRDLGNRGTLSDFNSGFADGMRVTPEDRRDMLWAIRDREGKSEPPRGTQTFATQPSIDMLRQIKTIDPEGLGALIPLKPFDDEAFILRANAGMNVGPNPNQIPGLERMLITDKRGDAAGLARYKEVLRNETLAQKVGQVLGTASSDLVNDSTRAIWWLLNAPQAVVNVSSEQLSGSLNPDLFARREVGLPEAVDKGWVSYKKPFIEKDELDKRIEIIKGDAETGLLNRFMNQQDDPVNPYSQQAFDKDMAVLQERSKREALQQLEDEARADVKNYRRARPGVKITGKGKILKNRFNPNLVNAATIVPAALAINAGIGLLGRREGYAAVVPDELDETKTANAIAEVASRYLLGREGRLLDVEDFLLERPDSTRGEYQAYKSYLRDRDIDINPFDDGKMNLGGVFKTNPDGIRGAEISFLGKSLPVNDTLIPTASAIAGTALGAALTNAGSIRMRGGFKNRKGLGKVVGLMPEVLPRDRDGNRQLARQGDGPINRMQAMFDKDDGPMHNLRVLGTVGGMGLAGMAGGMAVGNTMEEDRRRKKFEERKGYLDYDTYKQSAQRLLDERRRRKQENPERYLGESKESKAGANKRNQQEGLQTYMLDQQTLVDQLVNEERKARGQQAVNSQQWANNKFYEIEKTIKGSPLYEE